MLAVVDHSCAVMVMMYDGKSHPSEDARHKGWSSNEAVQRKPSMRGCGHFPQVKVDYSKLRTFRWEGKALEEVFFLLRDLLCLPKH